jgi:hypothetical protein
MQSIIGDSIQWVPLYRYEGLYEVSSYGDIRAAIDIVYQHGSRFGVKGSIAHKQGDLLNIIDGVYYAVTIYDPRENATPRSKNLYIHEAVSTSFQGHDDGLVVDHIDGNKHNNCLSNLQRITHKANNIKAYKNDENGRWTNRKSAVIRSDGVVYKNLQAAIKDNNIKSSPCIINAIKRHTKCSGYYWQYTDINKQQSIDADVNKRKIDVGNRSAWIRCIEHDRLYIQSDLQRLLNVADDVIYRAITMHDGYSAYLDLHFELVPESDIDYSSEYIQKYIVESQFYQHTRIKCIQSDIVYPTTKFASNALNISVDYIRRSIRENYTGKCGLTFVKI